MGPDAMILVFWMLSFQPAFTFIKRLFSSFSLSAIRVVSSAYLMEKAMAPHSSTLAWKIPRAEEPGRLQSMGSRRVRHDWVTSLSYFTFIHWKRKWQPTPFSCLENPRDGGAWWAAVCGVAQSQTWLKRLSSSSSSTRIRTDHYRKHSSAEVKDLVYLFHLFCLVGFGQ